MNGNPGRMALGFGGIVLVLILCACSITGCKRMQEPSIKDENWTNLKVRYSLGALDAIKTETWETKDPKILKHLRDSFESEPWKSAGVLGLVDTNEATLDLASGKVWTLCVVDEIMGFVSVYDRTNPVDAWDTVVSDHFIQTLKETIAKEKGHRPTFSY